MAENLTVEQSALPGFQTRFRRSPKDPWQWHTHNPLSLPGSPQETPTEGRAAYWEVYYRQRGYEAQIRFNGGHW